ncbi:hypothetical protein J3362_19390 [Marinobacter sp. NFXS11]|uniref:hypothetical protein n=1 Tax=Marinobacter sp. NFXS11 TaxID=2818432 RepID=UPI0032DE7AC4
MSNVLVFRPKAQISAKQQLKEFILFAKTLTGYDKPNEPLNWNGFDWSFWIKGVNFGKLGESIRSKAFDPDKGVLDSSIIEFAKAYVLYQQSLAPTDDVKETVALQLLEASLMHANAEADVTEALASDFDRAASMCREKFSEGRAYRIGGALEKLAEFLAEKCLTKSGISWTNSIPRPNDARGHRKNKENAAKKMPSTEVLDALGEIWSNNPESSRDIFVTSNCVILLSQPSRVGELNLLANRCLPPEYENQKAISSEVVGDSVESKRPLTINWFGEKGFGHSPKLVPTALAEHCIEAIRRIRSITEGPRKLAKFLEENPDSFPPHDRSPRCDQDAPLNADQALGALCLSFNGKTSRGRLREWLAQQKRYFENKQGMALPNAIVNEALAGMYEGKAAPGKEDRHTLTLRKLNVLVRARYLPPHFPYVDKNETIKYRDALNCYFVGQLGEQEGHGHGHLKPYMIRSIDNNTLNQSLTMNAGSEGSKRSEGLNIFRRWGYNGDQYKLTTHQFRHYLNTLAARGNVGETELARWSGRLDLSQNKVYNHRSDEELVGEAKSMGLGEQKSNLIAVVSSNEPILASDLVGMLDQDRVAHRTLIGVCIHDFAMEPCQKDRDCLGCSEHVCIKGDEERLKRIRVLRDGLKKSLAEAQQGVEEGYFGADKWVIDRLDRLKRANELIALLEDPSLEDGAVIRCTDNGYLPAKKALEANGKLPDTANSKLGSDRNRVEVVQDELRALMEF